MAWIGITSTANQGHSLGDEHLVIGRHNAYLVAVPALLKHYLVDRTGAIGADHLLQRCKCAQRACNAWASRQGGLLWALSIFSSTPDQAGCVPNQAENDALQQLVVEVAANKAEARAKVARLKEKYNHLLKKVGRSS